jgi:hypothetical protein
MDKTSKCGKYWYDASSSQDFVSMIDYQRQIYNHIKDLPEYRAGNACFLTGSKFTEISNKFPMLEEFRKKYNLEKRISYLEYKDGKLYKLLPHDHESVSSTVFFPIYYSDYVGTAFYEPTEQELITTKPSLLGMAIGDPLDKVRYTCSLTVTPTEVVGGFRPLIYRTSQLHTAVEIEPGHPENYSRVSCAWDSNYSFDDMVKLIT